MQLQKNALQLGLRLLPVGVLCSIYLAMTNITVMRQGGMDAPVALLVFSSLIQVAFIYTLTLSYVGYLLAQKTDLIKPFAFVRKETVYTILVGFGCALVMVSDYFLFAPLIPQIKAVYTKESFTLVSLLFSMLYGGIIEEIMLRLFFLSLVVFIFDLMGRKTKNGKPLPRWYYWTANTLAALLFALGHLPATQMAFGSLTPLLVGRAFLLNGVLGFVFGLLYIQKGLQYAMLAHALTHLFNQAILRFFIL